MIHMFTKQIDATTVEKKIKEFMEYDNRLERVAYLTFDDGPSIYTMELLKILREYNAPATFFVLGESIEIVPDSHQILRNIYDEGHYIGLHSMTHDRNKLYFSSNSSQTFVKEMLELKEVIYEILDGYETDLCRAPHGTGCYFQESHWKAVKEAGLECIDWNVDSRDWYLNSTGEVYQQIISEITSREFPNEVVVLFHEKEVTIKSLPLIIEYLRESDYAIVQYMEGEEIGY